MYHVSYMTCTFFGQSSETSQWRVCYKQATTSGFKKSFILELMVEIVCHMNMNLYVLQNISDQNICFLQNFIKTNPKEICEIFVYEND